MPNETSNPTTVPAEPAMTEATRQDIWRAVLIGVEAGDPRFDPLEVTQQAVQAWRHLWASAGTSR